MPIFNPEQSTPEKDNYFIQQKDIGGMGLSKISVMDDTNLYNITIQNGEVIEVSTPDGTNTFDVSHINSQLNAGATLGSSIVGEKTSVAESKLQRFIKQSIRTHLLK